MSLTPEQLHEGCRCQECGYFFYSDVVLSNDLWNRIRLEGKPESGGLLCGNCIGRRLSAIVAKVEADLAVARAALEKLLVEIRWCSGSPDFNPGGQARLGWERGPHDVR